MELNAKTESIISFLESYPVFSASALEKVLGLPERSIRMNRSRNLTEENADKIFRYLLDIQFEGYKGDSMRRVTPLSQEDSEKVLDSMKADAGVESKKIVEGSGSVLFKNVVGLTIVKGESLFTEGGLKRRRVLKDVKGVGRGVDDTEEEFEVLEGYESPMVVLRKRSTIVCDYKFESEYILFYKKK